MTASTTPPTFSLVDDPWIACLMMDGSRQVLSLSEVFSRLTEIRGLSGESVQQDYVVLRVLLVIFWRAQAPKATEGVLSDWWSHLFENVGGDGLVVPVRDYLAQWKDRFNLFDKAHPFMQVPDLATAKGEPAGVQRLIPEAEQDYFTLRSGAGREWLSYSEATRWLIALQAWDYSGIKPGALGDSRVKGGKGYPIGTGWAGNTGGVVIHGQNLGQTLLLNTSLTAVFGDANGVKEDLPAWERDPQSASGRAVEIPEGPCDILTWQSRCVRLFTDGEKVTGVLVTNGNKIDIREHGFKDPMTAYRYSKAQTKSNGPNIFFAKSHSEERTLWRGVSAILIQSETKDSSEGKEDRAPETIQFLSTLRNDEILEGDVVVVELVGFVYGPQSSIITDSIHEVVPLRFHTLLSTESEQRGEIVLAAQKAVSAAIHLGQFAGFLKEAVGGTYEFVPAATERVLNLLETEFKDWLLTLEPKETYAQDLDSQSENSPLDRWFATIRAHITAEAEILARGAGTKALLGRVESSDDGGNRSSRILSTATALQHLNNLLNKTLKTSTEKTQESHR